MLQPQTFAEMWATRPQTFGEMSKAYDESKHGRDKAGRFAAGRQHPGFVNDDGSIEHLHSTGGERDTRAAPQSWSSKMKAEDTARSANAGKWDGKRGFIDEAPGYSGSSAHAAPAASRPSPAAPQAKTLSNFRRSPAQMVARRVAAFGMKRAGKVGLAAAAIGGGLAAAYSHFGDRKSRA